MTRFYVLPNLATLTELTGIEQHDIRYNETTSVYHIGQDPIRQVGVDENDEPIMGTSVGYHINTSAAIEDLAAYEVFPNNPMTQF